MRALPRAIACAVSDSATGEWKGHISLDGEHPDGKEQQMIWLMNRARQNPIAEGVWLATSSEPSIADARDGFGVDTNQLQSEFSELPVVQPTATVCDFNPDLVEQNSYLLPNPFNDDAGNPYIHTIYAHAGFNIDYGFDQYGMTPDRPHRANIMANESSATWVDITYPSSSELLITGNYNYQNTQQFIVGTVWEDKDGNGRYDEEEGISGAKVTINPPGTNGYDHVITSKGGGYSIPVTTGTYTVTFSSDNNPRIPDGELGEVEVEVKESLNALADYQLIRCDVLEDDTYTVLPDTYTGPDPYVICSKTKIIAGSDDVETTVAENGILRFNSPSIAIQHKFNVKNAGAFRTSNISGMYLDTPL